MFIFIQCIMPVSKLLINTKCIIHLIILQTNPSNCDSNIQEEGVELGATQPYGNFFGNNLQPTVIALIDNRSCEGSDIDSNYIIYASWCVCS
jgi:hypothetical protein